MYRPHWLTGKSRSRLLKIGILLRELSWFHLSFWDLHRPFEFLVKALWPKNYSKKSVFVCDAKKQTSLRSQSRLMLIFHYFHNRSGSYTCVLRTNRTWPVLSSSTCPVDLCVVLDSVYTLTWQDTTCQVTCQVAPSKAQAQIVRRTIRLIWKKNSIWYGKKDWYGKKTPYVRAPKSLQDETLLSFFAGWAGSTRFREKKWIETAQPNCRKNWWLLGCDSRPKQNWVWCGSTQIS